MGALGYTMIGVVAVLLALCAVMVWGDIKTPDVKHPFDDDMPSHW